MSDKTKTRNDESEERDRLSGLLNRHAGERCLEEELYKTAQRQQSVCVVLLDVNDLTEINRLYGHIHGDEVLQHIAMELQGDLCQGEYAARISGDEFLCIYPNINRAQAHERLQRIMSDLRQHSLTSMLTFAFCYGVRELQSGQQYTAKRVIMECDEAMYQWKRRYHLDKARAAMVHHVEESDDVKSFAYDSEKLLHALSDSCDDYLYVCNMQKDPSTFLYSNAMVEEFGLPGQVVKDAALIWGSHIHEADKQAFLDANQEIADNRSDYHNVEYRARNARGEWVWLRCRGHVERDVDGQPILFAGMITDLGRKNKMDHLTGLFNKYEFEDTIEQLLLQRDHKPFGVMLLDMDRFSAINKLYNHHFGDAVLKKTAQQIQSLLPQGVKMFRHDGDEFHVIFTHEDNEHLMKEVFANIQDMFRAQQELDDKYYHISVSAGSVICPRDAIDLMNISKNLRYALDHSKRNGRNRLSFFENEMRMREMREMDLLEQLRYSVEHDFLGFDLHFQPQVSADTQTIIGAEALARWNNDIYGNVPPLVFIPLLEKSGLIHEVGRWIFQTALHRCKEFMQVMPSFVVSINLSYVQLADPYFVDFMRDTLRSEQIDSKHIIVEMTESYMIKDDVKQRALFERIRKLGIRIAMDDFGTGFSSLGVLKKSPADIVKIDKVFIKDILTSSFDATFIRFIVTLCHDVDIQVLLEGVETQEEYEKVKEMGLDYIQGYYFGKPLPDTVLKKKLSARM